MKKFISILVILLVLPGSAWGAKFRIKIENLTINQLLTAPLCAIHGKNLRLYTLGAAPSAGLAELAEDGPTETLMSEIGGLATRVRVGDFIAAGEEGTLSIGASNGRLLSCVAMLATTNDGFIGFRVKLPREIGASRSFTASAYDAGSERNNESCAFVPGAPCSAHFVRDTVGAEGVVAKHPGITGIGDLSVVTHGWNDSPVRVTIMRIR